MAIRLAQRFRTALATLAACLFVATAWAQTLQPLAIETRGGRRDFSVEFAGNDAERAQGLMYRRSLAPDRGMLFDFGTVQPVAMWMQNTYVSLDMLFLRPDGSIARIAEDTEPLSTRTISSGEPVLGVLEVAAGTVKKLGIQTGDRVVHPLFRRK